MTVAQDQIREVLDVIETWVLNRHTRAALLADLTKTKAYQRNLSFRQTVDRLLREQDRREGGQ